jgi:hypothetical protein
MNLVLKNESGRFLQSVFAILEWQQAGAITHLAAILQDGTDRTDLLYQVEC